MAMNVTNKYVDAFIGITIFATVISALIGTVLAAFTNLSGSGIALAVLFSTVAGLLLAVAVWKGFQKILGF